MMLMTEAWKHLEGQVAAGQFHLLQILGIGRDGPVFLTEIEGAQPARAAIRLVPAHADTAEATLARWRDAASLSHPNLIRLLDMGRCEVNGTEFLYLVMERADEDLSKVLSDRALTEQEATDVLQPVLDALAFLHGKGFAHAHLKPASILAVGERLKLSSDRIAKAGARRGGDDNQASPYDAPELSSRGASAPGDVWALGVTLVEALTQRLPEGDGVRGAEPVLPAELPEPLHEIARNCLRSDPRSRWTVAQIRARLRGESPLPIAPPAQPVAVAAVLPARPEARPQPAARPQLVARPLPPAETQLPAPKRSYLIPGIALLLGIAAAALLGPKLFDRAPAPAPTQTAPPPLPAAPPSQSTAEPPGPPSGPALREPPSPAAPPVRQTPRVSRSGFVPGKAIEQAMPSVPARARNTIHGTVRINVRVTVDEAGNVAGAKLAPPAASAYLSRFALDAARRWKFQPPQVDGRNIPSIWNLRFSLGRSATKVVPVDATPR